MSALRVIDYKIQTWSIGCLSTLFYMGQGWINLPLTDFFTRLSKTIWRIWKISLAMLCSKSWIPLTYFWKILTDVAYFFTKTNYETPESIEFLGVTILSGKDYLVSNRQVLILGMLINKCCSFKSVEPLDHCSLNFHFFQLFPATYCVLSWEDFDLQLAYFYGSSSRGFCGRFDTSIEW